EAAEGVEHYIEIRYEDLVADPEPVLRRICDLVELDYDPEMLSYHERSPERLSELDQPLRAEGSKRGLTAESRQEAHARTAEPPLTQRRRTGDDGDRGGALGRLPPGRGRASPALRRSGPPQLHRRDPRLLPPLRGEAGQAPLGRQVTGLRAQHDPAREGDAGG